LPPPFAPTGDQSRDSTASMFDYQRNYMQELVHIYSNDGLAKRAQAMLTGCSVPVMANSFMAIDDFLYDNSDVTAGTMDGGTAYYASGIGEPLDHALPHPAERRHVQPEFTLLSQGEPLRTAAEASRIVTMCVAVNDHVHEVEPDIVSQKVARDFPIRPDKVHQCCHSNVGRCAREGSNPGRPLAAAN